MRITDKMRLDYIQRTQDYGAIVERACFSNGPRFALAFSEGYSSTIRKAIDIAIKQETKSRALKGEKLKGGV